MHRLPFSTFATALILSLLPAAPVSQQVQAGPGEGDPERAAAHVLVEVENSAVALSLGPNGRALGQGWHRIPVPNGVDPAKFVADLTARHGVRSAEVELVFQAMVSIPFAPNDPLYAAGPGNPTAQWHLHVIDLSDAWQSTVGNLVRVAVLDSGVSPGPDGFCHPLVAEYDATNGSAGPGSAADDDGHGTHVAGTIAQCSGNGIGGAGVATDARIIPVDVFVGEVAFASDIAMGIDHAIANGADVINLSLGVETGSSQVINQAIARAVDAGIVLIAASGNSGGPVFYPANHPDVIAVGATTINGGVASYSSRGVGLELVAPGGTSSAPVWQETMGTYQGSAGTSMAAAHVSGVVALLKARHPGASALQVRSALACSAMDLAGPGWDTDSGFGLVRAGDAVEVLGMMVSSGAVTCDGQTAGSSKVGTVGIATGLWRLYLGATQIGSFYYGTPGDLGFFGDWDCDGVDTPGLYRQSNGFVYLRNSNTQGFADVSFFFGIAGDIPVAGDFDGDGCDTVSIYRPSEARFHIINHLGTASADYSFLFGVKGDVPFMGDWNGDGTDTPGLRRPSNGFVYLRDSNTQGFADIDFFYGIAGDVVFSGDWDADGADSIGLYRPSNGIIYLRNQLSTGVADSSFPVGGGVLPVSGDF